MPDQRNHDNTNKDKAQTKEHDFPRLYWVKKRVEFTQYTRAKYVSTEIGSVSVKCPTTMPPGNKIKQHPKTSLTKDTRSERQGRLSKYREHVRIL
mmetsp:Transcript_41471/g.67306  ORF Transcript_41471/g.67306 Transcript_41471/m.67306 type:complete len:95 (+) Transcript_41471:708-992(+)